MTRHVSAAGHAARTQRGVAPALAAVIAGATLGGVVACTTLDGDTSAGPSGEPSSIAASAPAPAPTPTPTPTPEPAELTILAAGDVLTHTPVNRSAQQADGSYDYSTMLSGVDPWVAGADLALCHMEVPVSPDGELPSGYPMFGASAALVRDLAEQGWDGCSTASNHSVDRGWDGVKATLDAFDLAGLGHVGTARTQAEADASQLYELERADRTITVAHLSATFGTNGLPVPADEPWAVELIDSDTLIAQATQAREDGADLVVVSMHAGTEYTTTLTDQQVTVGQALADSGVVDLVIGHHAHVPQSIEKLDGGPDGSGMWIAHGLGNFLSNQDENCCVAATSSGVVLTATVVEEPDGPARVMGAEWSAVTVDRQGGHALHVVEDVANDPEGVGTLSQDELQARLVRVREAVGTSAPERTTAPTPSGPAPVVVARADQQQ